MKHIHPLFALAALLPSGVVAYNGHRVTEGPLRLTIADVPAITAYDQPAPVTVTAKNLGKEPLNVEIEVAGLVDQWRPVGQTKQSLQLGPDAEAQAVFQIAAHEGAYSVHYPVHVYARFECQGKRRVAHAVQIFVPQFAKKDVSARDPTDMTAVLVPAHGAVSLYTSRLQRVAWRYYDKPMMYRLQGWQGSVAECRAGFHKRRGVTRGTTRQAIGMHPPWVPGGGTIFAEYLVKLPDTKPIKLTFANAIRTHTAEEPPSDGVTFRVWAGDAKLFERHTDSKAWVEGEADLSPYAGQQLLLRLESHPGPKRNTTCDGSYWAEPTIVTGRVPEQLTDAEREGLRERARRLVRQPRRAGKDEVVYWLGRGDDAPVFAAILGKHGVLDGCLAFGRGDKCVTFDGLRVSVMGHPVGQWPSSVVQKGMRVSRGTSSTSFGHHLELSGEAMELLVSIRPERPGLRISVRFPDDLRRRVRVRALKHPPNVRITDISLGPADQKAPRVYYGHGYCIVEPQAFRAGFGGHNLSTSHVGFDFEQGVSLLTACDMMHIEGTEAPCLVVAGRGDAGAFWAGALPGKVELRERLIEDEEAIDLFRRCGLLVLPYVDATQSALIAAAYYFRKPVVVTYSGALPEYVVDGVTGRVIEADPPAALARCLEEMLGDRERLRRMGEAGRAWYDEHRALEERDLIAMYTRLARQHAPASAAAPLSEQTAGALSTD